MSNWSIPLHWGIEGNMMSKRQFRQHTRPADSRVAYPSWAEVVGRRGFLAALGAAVAVGWTSCGDRAAPEDPDSGPPVADQGIAPDVTSPAPDLERPESSMGWPDIWPDQHPPWVAGDVTHDASPKDINAEDLDVD